MRGSWGYTAGPGTPAGRGVCFPPSRTPRGPPLSRGPSHSPAPACQPIRALRPWPTLGGGDTAMRQPIGTRGAGTAPRSANHGARPGDPARFERLSRRRMRGEQLLRRRRRRRTPRGRQRRGSDAAAHRPGEPGRSASPSRGSLLRAPGLPRGLSRQVGKAFSPRPARRSPLSLRRWYCSLLPGARLWLQSTPRGSCRGSSPLHGLCPRICRKRVRAAHRMRVPQVRMCRPGPCDVRRWPGGGGQVLWVAPMGLVPFAGAPGSPLAPLPLRTQRTAVCGREALARPAGALTLGFPPRAERVPVAPLGSSAAGEGAKTPPRSSGTKSGFTSRRLLDPGTERGLAA